MAALLRRGLAPYVLEVVLDGGGNINSVRRDRHEDNWIGKTEMLGSDCLCGREDCSARHVVLSNPAICRGDALRRAAAEARVPDGKTPEAAAATWAEGHWQNFLHDPGMRAKLLSLVEHRRMVAAEAQQRVKNAAPQRQATLKAAAEVVNINAAVQAAEKAARNDAAEKENAALKAQLVEQKKMLDALNEQVQRLAAGKK